MERTQKVWGERWLLREDSTHAISYLELKAKTCCSFHKHQAKFNLFFLIDGHVSIKTEFGETKLHPGQIFTVKPGEPHMFIVHENSKMIEEMYVSYDETDIERFQLGSKL